MPVLEFMALVTTFFSYNVVVTSELFYKQYLELEHYVLCAGNSEVTLAKKTSLCVSPQFLFAFFGFHFHHAVWL